MISHQFGPESEVSDEEESMLPPDIHDAAVAFLSNTNRRVLLSLAEEVLAAAAQNTSDPDFLFARFFTPKDCEGGSPIWFLLRGIPRPCRWLEGCLH